jgi:hypothetical protein
MSILALQAADRAATTLKASVTITHKNMLEVVLTCHTRQHVQRAIIRNFHSQLCQHNPCWQTPSATA